MKTGPLLGLLAVPLLLGGCAAGAAEALPAPDPVATASAGPVPENAAMVCNAEISDQLVEVLDLDAAPEKQAAWDGEVYSCTHDLPAGPLVLSVHVSGSDVQAVAFFEQRSTELPGAESLIGLGEQAFDTPEGTVLVIKDHMTLTVDPSALPAVIGDNGQTRSALAFEMASLVMGCWIEHG